MRACPIWLTTAIVLSVPPFLDAQAVLSHDLSTVRRWLDAVDRHQPGAADAAAKAVASWSDEDLDRLLVDVHALVRLAVRSPGPLLPPNVVRYTTEQLNELTSIAEAERKRGINKRLKHAALLHTDIASLALAEVSTSVRRASGTGRMVSVLMQDGLGAGFQGEAVHWEFARSLLDDVRPDPGHDDTVRAWYRAAAGFFVAGHVYSEAVPLLERALRLFPDDAQLLVDRGCAYEALGAPRIQNFVATAVMPTGVILAVRSAADNWKQAERMFRRAADLDDRGAEVHLRLGRVIGLQGRHVEAIAELERAAAVSHDKRIRYFAALFLGAEHQATGRLDRARAAFEEAASLYPRAQSPRLAWSGLARQAGDRAGALRALQVVLEGGASEAQRSDPWWTYFDGQDGEVARVMAQARVALYLDDRP